MGAEPDRLIQVAGLVSDGQSVDWKAAQKTAQDDEERRTLRFLERIASIVQAHDRLHAEAEAQASAATLPADPRALHAAAAAVAAVPARWGRLELRGILGAGTFAEVHRAFDPDLGREVALKLLRASVASGSVEAALREGRLLARIRHPNVVTVHGAERHDDRMGVWMELVHGRTLEVARREQGTFGAREAAVIGIDLCRALTAVHQAGLVHRDINARNIMRADGGRIVLMDFGAGRETTDTGAGVAGTPYFMAPEVLRGEPATPRSDIYSVGVVLFHLVTGRYPVAGASMLELGDAHAAGKVVLLREARADLDPAFVRAVEKALAPDPALRWASAGQMEQALAASLGAEAEVGDDRKSAGTRPPKRYGRQLALAAAVALPVVAAVTYWVATRRPAEPASSAQPQVQAPVVDGAAAAMQVQVAFFRRHDGARAPIAHGERVEPGDGLALELRSNVPVHVYVVSDDERGDTHLLFPLPGFEPTNPLAQNRTWVLPGTRGGTAFDWEISSAGGRERLLVVASRERLTDLEADLLALPRADSDAGPQYAELSAHAVERLRGIGALQERPVDPATAGRQAGSASQLDDVVQRLLRGVETAPGIWVQRIEFENPR